VPTPTAGSSASGGGLSTAAISGIAIGAFILFGLILCIWQQRKRRWQTPSYPQGESRNDGGGGGGYTGQRGGGHWSSGGKLQFPEPLVPPYKAPKEEIVIHGGACMCTACSGRRRNDEVLKPIC